MVVHPDGSFSDVASSDESGGNGLFSGGVIIGGNGTFPTKGLEVGQTDERTISFPLLGPGQTVDIPMKTTLQALAIEDGRPAARMKQSYNVPEKEAPFGPFGATGTAKVHLAGDGSYSLDLGTGWPLRGGAVVGYGLSVQGEGQEQQSVEFNIQYAMTMDQQTLAEE